MDFTKYNFGINLRLVPSTGEIGLKIITTAKISNEFSRESPNISYTFLRESPNFQANFHVSKRSPRHSKDLTGKLLDLEIQLEYIRYDLLRERTHLIVKLK
jgi:hypothetical protein